jgi:hypothetical protein
MRERAALLGGRLTIESTPGGGTTVFVEIPVADDRPPGPKDLEACIDKLAGDDAIKIHLDGLPDSIAGFKQQVATKADRNIGYLDAQARAIDQALVKPDSQILAALLAVKTLPANPVPPTARG